MTNNVNKRVFSNLIWRFAERCGAQGVAFIVSVVLARLLEPSAYGTIALITVFTNILQTFVDSGFGNALIQKKDADDLDFSTVFFFNLSMCVILYAVMFLGAPVIATFYGDNELTAIIRVLSLTLIISGVKNVQQAYVSKKMQFKRFFFATIGGTIGAAIIGITMAYLGYGVWALVVQQLFNMLVDTIILWITVKWRPRFQFSLKRLKKLFAFGWKLLVSSLLDKTYNQLRQLIIGKLYSSADLAQYNRGKQFPDVIVTNINTSIDSVLLPAMSNEQDDSQRVKSMTRRAIKISTYIMAPLMLGLAFTATPVVKLILTRKWLPSVFFMRIFCITFVFYPIHTANLNAIKAMGRSDLFLKLEIIKKIVGIFALIATMWISVKAMAYSLLFTSVVSQLINSYPNRKLLNYGYLEQMKDILPNIILALVMGICIIPIQYLDLSDFLILTIQIICGVLIYIGGSKILKIDSFEYLYKLFLSYLKKGGTIFGK